MPMSLTKDQGKNNSGVSDFNEKPSSPSPREFGPLLSATGIKCAPNSRGEGGEEQSICFHVGRGGKLGAKSQFKFAIEHWNPLTPRPLLPKIRIEFDDNGKQ